MDLDYITFLSLGFEDHKIHLRTVSELFEAAGVTLCLSKPKLIHDEVNYLGHMIKSGAFGIAPDLINTVQEVTPSQTVRGSSRS